MKMSDPLNPLGSGIATLFMLVFGVGCLYMAGHGLLTGTIDGASGSPPFTWARKPVKFLLIVLFWAAPGLGLLLASWRGMAPAEAGDSDQTDSDDHDQDREAYRGQAVGGNTPWKATVRDPLKSAELPGDVRQAEPALRSTASAVRQSLRPSIPPTLPPPLHLCVSRPYAVLALVVMVLFTINSGFTAVALGSALGPALSALLFVPVALACVRVAIQCVRNFFWDGPVLMLDRFGLTNHRTGGHLIPWTEVDAVRLDASSSATYLVLRFRLADDLRAHFGWWRLLPSVLQRVFYKGFEGRVKLTSLSFTRAEVLRVAQAFLRHARR